MVSQLPAALVGIESIGRLLLTHLIVFTFPNLRLNQGGRNRKTGTNLPLISGSYKSCVDYFSICTHDEKPAASDDSLPPAGSQLDLLYIVSAGITSIRVSSDKCEVYPDFPSVNFSTIKYRWHRLRSEVLCRFKLGANCINYV